MNPLLFADWARLNRLFIRTMWVAAAIMICVVCIAIAAPGASSHAAAAPARSAAVAGASR